MTIAMQPIYTQTASGSVSVIYFNNIPQTFTDLQIVISTRTTAAVTATDIFSQFNNDGGNNYSGTRLYAQGSAASSDRQSTTNVMRFGDTVGTSATANTFSSASITIPNYISANFKQVIVDAVSESNTATGYYSYLNAMLWRSTAAITTLWVGALSGNFVAGSTFTLYGITKG
jgi:hypothetical protein